jgi:alpha,alpha-trehalase
MNQRAPAGAAAPATRPLQAAVFDLDGVVTLTARVHAAAWKALFDEFLQTRAARLGERFVPFDASADYRAFVDGRPRYEGVRVFLESRDIKLPPGSPSDPPELETLCALGNRKNALFTERLERDGVDVDAAAVALVYDLRANGIAVGLASSSKNALPILERAGLADLFAVRVDGRVSEQLDLAGKPHPDIFLLCLALLGDFDPARSMVVEDAGSGVAAGRAGGFGLVLGVDRANNHAELRRHGADWIVRDLRQAPLERILAYCDGWQHRKPNALFAWDAFVRRLRGRTPAVFLDYDGTLTPIVSRPELAVLSDEMRQTVGALAAVWPTHIVSGRGLDDVTRLVNLDSLYYAASHGFDIAGPAGSPVRLEVDAGMAAPLAAAVDELREAIAGVPGAIVESKKFSVAVHYREVAEAHVPELEGAVDRTLARHPELKRAAGKKVFELRPARDWDKGKAVNWLLRELGLDRPDVVPVYIGDDVTDEDAFAEITERGIGIVVTDLPRPTAGRFSLQDTFEVRAFLQRLAALPRPAPS